MKFSRTDQSRIAEWWFTVDHKLLAAILSLLVVGVVLSLAASPAIAQKRGFAPYHFVERQLLFAGLSAVVVLGMSLLSPQNVRRVAALTLGLSIAGMALVLVTGQEINGAKRWLSLKGHSLQPSEFMKPGFVVVSAWLLAQSRERPEMPGLALACSLAALVTALLIAEPDIGQTMLALSAWGVVYLISGQPLAGAGLIVGAGAMTLFGAYHSRPYIKSRIDRYLAPKAGDNSQVDRAMQAFTEGGFFGRGPGEGTVKTVLPDAHTDFSFAVVAEEYGIAACLCLLALFFFISGRAVWRASRDTDPGIRIAVMGLAAVFSFQALINMGVNVGLLPAKGMTLPFISAGGSSTLAVALTLGMLVALTRKRTDLASVKTPPVVRTRPAAPGGGREKLDR